MRSQKAIVDAARELLLSHGPGAITHARVAETAGVARATVYRHWPRTDQLLAEAMATVPMPFFDSASLPTRDWLIREITLIARELDHHDVRAVATTLANAALWEEGMDARRARFATVLAGRLADALEAAQARGEVVLRSPRAMRPPWRSARSTTEPPSSVTPPTTTSSPPPSTTWADGRDPADQDAPGP